jgi:hypothetical protein
MGTWMAQGPKIRIIIDRKSGSVGCLWQAAGYKRESTYADRVDSDRSDDPPHLKVQTKFRKEHRKCQS